jgi:hypothetical protein
MRGYFFDHAYSSVDMVIWTSMSACCELSLLQVLTTSNHGNALHIDTVHNACHGALANELAVIQTVKPNYAFINAIHPY